MAQMVKNLPVMQETWVWSLGQEDPLEKGMATHSSILAWEPQGQWRLVGCRLWGRTESHARWIMEKAREFQKNIYFCFIDYARAFDCVDHNKLQKILK